MRKPARPAAPLPPELQALIAFATNAASCNHVFVFTVPDGFPVCIKCRVCFDEVTPAQSN